MILNIKDILNHPSRCEEWTDERTIRFMNSEPNQGEGTKSLRDFIDSIGIEDITYSDIFFCTVNHIGDRDILFKYCIDTIEYINTQYRISGVSTKLDSLKNYAEVPKSDSYLRNSKENMQENIQTKIASKRDIDTEVRILKLISKILDSYFISDTNMVDETVKVIRMISDEYKEMDYLFHLNRLETFLEGIK